SGAQGWCDDSHLSGSGRGAMIDWVFISTEITATSGKCYIADQVTNLDPTATWWPNRQELLGLNVVSGEIRHFAHHRSREVSKYCTSPRVNANWDGTALMFTSNFGA